MVLAVPPYIAEVRFQYDPLRYTWDDWDLDRAESPVDESLLADLQQLSQRANVAYCSACAEWVAYPLCALLKDDFPLQRLEGAWAQVIDPRYSWSLADSPEKWAGPIKRPVLRAIELIQFAVDAMDRDQSPAEIAATSAKLATHLWGHDVMPFLKWQGRVVARLLEHYRLDADETMGDVVPREALDPEHSFDPANTQDLINDFLQRLCGSNNPFLCSNDEMSARGYKGPYCRFDQEYDRKLRFEW